MKIKRIILIIWIIILISVFALNTSFAASNETIDKYKTHQIDTYDKKIITMDHVSEWSTNNYNGKGYLTFNVKKAYKDKYKIKSIKARYYTNDGIIYKTYNVKNKTKVILKYKNELYPGKFTVNYYTKGKIKNESINIDSKHNWKSTTYFYGKKANIVLKESGYVRMVPNWGGVPVTNYQKFKVITKSKKYKIKMVKTFFFGMAGVDLVKTYKGYGKTKLTNRIYGTYEVTSIGAFRMYYY